MKKLFAEISKGVMITSLVNLLALSEHDNFREKNRDAKMVSEPSAQLMNRINALLGHHDD